MIFKKSLDAEIAEIFAAGDTVASAKVTEILEKAADELDGLERAAKAARLKALDPVLGPDEARTAHMAMGEAQFAVDRRCAAIVKLRELETAREEAEADAKRRSTYEEARQLRDVAATLIKAKYPGIQRDLMEIIGKIAVAYGAVSHVNRDLPKGVEHLHHAEAVAFDYLNNSRERPIGYMPARIAEMMIPDLGNWAVPAWPPNWNALSGRPNDDQLAGKLALHRDRGKGRK